jgi:hypothetical protein
MLCSFFIGHVILAALFLPIEYRFAAYRFLGCGFIAALFS